MFERIHALGKKVDSLVSRGLGIGKKVVDKVDSIAGKVTKVLGFAKHVPFLPDSVRSKLDNVSNIVGKVSAGSSALQTGMGRVAGLQKEARGVDGIMSAAKVSKRAFYEGKGAMNFVKSTRNSIEKPKKSDAVSAGNKLQPAVPPSVRAIKRVVTDTPPQSGGRGIARPENDMVAKAMAAAQSAQSRVQQKPQKRGLLRR